MDKETFLNHELYQHYNSQIYQHLNNHQEFYCHNQDLISFFNPLNLIKKCSNHAI